MEAENERVLLNVFWRNACQVEPNWRGKLARGHAKRVLWLAVWHPSLIKAVWGEEGYRHRISKRQGVLEEKTREGWRTRTFAVSVFLERQSKLHTYPVLISKIVFFFYCWCCKSKKAEVVQANGTADCTTWIHLFFIHERIFLSTA